MLFSLYIINQGQDTRTLDSAQWGRGRVELEEDAWIEGLPPPLALGYRASAELYF